MRGYFQVQKRIVISISSQTNVPLVADIPLMIQTNLEFSSQVSWKQVARRGSGNGQKRPTRRATIATTVI